MGENRSDSRLAQRGWQIAEMFAVRVAVESPLLQLDREFDFLVPPEMSDLISWGSRVGFSFGRSKNKLTGIVVEVLNASNFARTPIDSVLGSGPVITKELYQFCRGVANRQVVATGEILQSAVPAHMPRIKVTHVPDVAPTKPKDITREVFLTANQEKLGDTLVPSWARIFVEKASEQLSAGLSSLLIAPESSDVEQIKLAAVKLGLGITVWDMTKKSSRFQNYHEVLGQTRVVVGTRSAIYAPVGNLGLIAVADDSDESYREVGSPKTNLRDLALLRAGENVSLLFGAPYRSVELQRLVEIGYLTELKLGIPTPRISFSKPGVRIDDASLKLAKEALLEGTLLVVIPRKGSSAAAFCGDCGERLRCNCGGFIWENSKDSFCCRLCGRPTLSCDKCRSSSFRRGRSGSSRTASEIGKMFPTTLVYEATQEKKPEITDRVNQIVVATPGSAPRLKSGYAGLLVLDTDVWLAAQNLQAEQHALRDWSEAVELLKPSGRAVFAGLGETLGKPLALWQHREIARASYLEAKNLHLPPAVRTVTLTGTPKQLELAQQVILANKGSLIRSDGKTASYRFAYSNGSKIASELRTIATSAKAVEKSGKTVRGFSITMDDMEGF